MKLEIVLAASLLPCMLSGQPADHGCKMSGQLFSIDPVLNEIGLKSPSGELMELPFDEGTAFIRLPITSDTSFAGERIGPESMDAGDEICALPGVNPGSKKVSEVLVVNRRQIEGQQKRAIASWLNSGAFGTVVIAEPEARIFVLHSELRGGSTRDILVDATNPAEIRRLLRPLKYVTSRRPQIHVGNRVYVRGETFDGGNSIRANQIWIGDFQAVAGTIDSLQPINETLALQEADAGQTISVRIKPPSLFMLDPDNRPSEHHLLPMEFSDLEKGDGVVVVGKLDASSGSMEGVALITDFGRFVKTSGSTNPVSWTLGNFEADIP